MLETHCSNDVRIAVGILDPLEAVSGADTPLATLAFMWQRPPSAEVVYGRSLTAAAAAMISLDGGLRACTGPREGRGKRSGRSVDLEEFSSCVATYFRTELVRNAVEIQLLFSAQHRKGEATLDRNATIA